MERRLPGRLPHVGAKSFHLYKPPASLGYWDEGGRLTISGPCYLLVGNQNFVQGFVILGAILFFLGLLIPHAAWLSVVGLALFFGGVAVGLALIRRNDALVTLTADKNTLTRVIDTPKGYRDQESWEIGEVQRIFVSGARRPQLVLEASDGSAKDLMLPGSHRDLERAAVLLNAAIRAKGGREF